MKRLLSGSVSAFVMASVVMTSWALAAERNMACIKADEARFIQVISPGQVGRICDVRYTRDRGRNVSIPYHADNSGGFCEQKAADLIATLKQAGYRCAPTTVEIIAQAKTIAASDLMTPGIIVPTPSMARTQTPNATLAQRSAEVIPSEAPAAVLPSVITSAPTQTEVAAAQITEQPEPALTQEVISLPEPEVPAPSQAVEALPEIPVASAEQLPHVALPPEAGQETDDALQDKMDQILAEIPNDAPDNDAPSRERPSIVEAPLDTPLLDTPPLDTPMSRELAEAGETTKLAVRGPAQLTNANSATDVTGRTSSVVGRIVGAAPELEPVTPVTQASLVAAPTSSRRPQNTRYQYSARSAQDIVLATLNAQVAAWNEGNLQAFMDMYWKSEDLKYVSGSTVTMGWTATLKQYRERYGNGTELGHLAIDKTDVQMVSEDVAIATGRFHHTDQVANAKGDFSLVMKRMNGVWRIVHDHSVDDPTQDQ